MFNLNRGHMAPAGNYSGSIGEKFLTVIFDIFSLVLLTSCLRMEQIMEAFGTLFRGIPEGWLSMDFVTLLRSSVDPFFQGKLLFLDKMPLSKKEKRKLNRFADPI